MPLDTGTKLGPYEILAPIGAGGMGEVYKAKDTRLDRTVAIKILPEHLADSPERKRRFEREAKAVAALSHPNILAIHDFGEEQGIAFAVMELLDGETLGERLRGGDLPPRKAVDYARQLAEGMAAAHERGIVHRDLKPQNIFITREGRVKLLDFGLAKEVDVDAVSEEGETKTRATRADAVMGTVGYMSPEQVRSESADARSDVFSFGAVLYEMLSGRRAFARSSAAETLSAVLRDDPPELSRLEIAAPVQLVRIVERCLEKQPGERFQSARDLAFALSTALEKRGESAAEEETVPSLVVLPFTNLSPDPDNEYFSDGLTEEITADLSKVHALRVISRRSAMQLKGTEKDLRTIGRELNVDYVLEGSVRTAGSSLRVTAELVDVARDAQLWADKYTGALDDVFGVQETLSRSIVDALKVELTPEEDRQIAARPVEDVHVYEYYHRARQEIHRGTADGHMRAFELVQKGLETLGEHEYLFAAKGLAHMEAMNFGALVMMPDETHLEKAEACAEKVFSLNADSPQGHYLRAALLQKHGKLQEGLREVKKAFAVEPNSPEILLYFSFFYMLAGKVSAARPLAKKMLEVDPLTPLSQWWWAWVEIHDGNLEVALVPTKRAYELNPGDLITALGYMWTLTVNRRLKEAYEVIDEVASRAPGSILSKLGVFLKYALQNDKTRALEMVTEEMIVAAKWDEHFSWSMANGYALLGEKELALEWLEHAALDRGFINYPFFAEYDPNLESLRGDVRFDVLMDKIKDRWERFEV